MNIESSVQRMLSRFNHLKWMMALGGIAVGIVAGFLVVLYRLAIEYGNDVARVAYQYMHAHPWSIIPWLAIIAIVGPILALLVKFEPMASGSGIPQVNGVIIHGFSMKWQRILPVRYVAGMIGGLFGLSLGREGPSIQMGGCGAQFISHRVRGNHREDTKERYLVTAGAAAGLSAAFSAPLSGMMFALEEVHRSFSPAILMGATAASLTSDFISKYCFGLRPVLAFGDITQLPLSYYGWLLGLGIVAGITGSVINRMLLGLQTLLGKVPWLLAPSISLLIALPIGIFLPQVLGGGANLIDASEHAEYGLIMLSILCLGKMIFTSTSFGSGMPGGIFMPILSVGALAGGVCGVATHKLFGLPHELIAVFVVCTMAGALSASVKAPITSILLTVEMSGSLRHMLPVAAVAFIALYISDLLHTKPIYAALLERYIASEQEKTKNREQKMAQPSVESRQILRNTSIGSEDKGSSSSSEDAHASFGRPVRGFHARSMFAALSMAGRTKDGSPQLEESSVTELPFAGDRENNWNSNATAQTTSSSGYNAATLAAAHNDLLEFPVQMGSFADGRSVRDIPWPLGSLLVGLRRGEMEFVPRGGTLLRSGDYLIVLFNSEDLRQLRTRMHELCEVSGDDIASERLARWHRNK